MISGSKEDLASPEVEEVQPPPLSDSVASQFWLDTASPGAPCYIHPRIDPGLAPDPEDNLRHVGAWCNPNMDAFRSVAFPTAHGEELVLREE